jgi:hypothetical protein
MKFSGWILAIVACLRERQFWHETLREAFYLITGSSSGLGVALTAAALGIGHRVMRTACAMASLQTTSDITFSVNTNA